jgi:hypothetical protein
MLVAWAWLRLRAAVSFIDTARPPASSEASAMREPLERRAKLFCKRELLLLRLSAERDAAVFVLTTILMRFV